MRTYNLLILLLIMGLVSCRKDKTSPINLGEDSECYTFPMLLQSSFVSEAKMYKQPCINPNNQNEFVFHFQDYSQNNFQLVKYNIQSNQKTILFQGNFKIHGQPKWSRKGWLAFTRVNPQSGYVDHIFITKDNGDSLRQLTNNIYNHEPVWDSSGENLYWAHSPVLGVPYFFLKKSLYGTASDTILMDTEVNQGYSAFNEISTNNILFSKTIVNGQFCIGKTELIFPPHPTLTEILNLSNPNYTGLSGLTINNSNQDIYVSFYNNGLYKLNPNSGQLILLIPFCNSKRYETISCSADGKFLIGERVDSRLELNANGQPTGKILEKSSIYLIDLETLKETKIELD